MFEVAFQLLTLHVRDCPHSRPEPRHQFLGEVREVEGDQPLRELPAVSEIGQPLSQGDWVAPRRLPGRERLIGADRRTVRSRKVEARGDMPGMWTTADGSGTTFRANFGFSL